MFRQIFTHISDVEHLKIFISIYNCFKFGSGYRFNRINYFSLISPIINATFKVSNNIIVPNSGKSNNSLALISNLLKDHFRVKVANNGEKALRVARGDGPPDLVLLDVVMPGMSGYDVCAALKDDAATRHIPVIFLTALNSEEDEQKGLDAGGADYISKPISLPIVLARINTQLQMKAAADFLRDKNSYLEHEVTKRTEELTAIQDVTILTMASLAETRDSDTGNHIRRTQHYVRALAEKLSDHPRFAAILTPRYIDLLYKSAPLHDIGKVGVPDRILLKPGRFTADEFEIMKTHTTLGRAAIEHAERSLGISVPFLSMAKEIAYSHQEKWDSTGYPEGIGGDDIPVSARLMAVADVYDALISRRIYKDGMPHEQAVGIVSQGQGSHFDPDIVAAFLEIHEQFRSIALRFADSDEDIRKKSDYLSSASGDAPVHPPG